MRNIWRMGKAHPHWVGRILLAIIAFVGYFLTVAPTVSFWDCGEFISAAHVVGIPHPPGTPFFVILGRAWELLLGFVGETAFRINLLSMMCSLVGVLFIQEIAREILAHFRIPAFGRAALAFLAGCLVAFSDTYWFNAVEAEVYGVSMAMMLASVWVVLRWDRSAQEHRNRWMVFFVYLTFLGLGVHTNAMLTFVPAWIYFGYRSGYIVAKRFFWILIAVMALLPLLLLGNPLLYGNIVFELVVGVILIGLVAKSLKEGELRQLPFWLVGGLLFSSVFMTGPFLAALAVAILFTGACALLFSKKEWASAFQLRHLFMLLFVAALGYSTQLVLPIRSSTEPVLDENDPETWQEVRDAMERKQYGTMGMLERALWRRAAWENQLGFSERIGYLGYHLNQFAPAPLGAQEPLDWNHADQGLMGYLQILHRILGELVLVLVLVSVASMLRRPQVAFVAALFLLTSMGLLFYVNFSDGSRPDSRDASLWHKKIQTLALQLKSENLPPLPSLEVMSESIQEYRTTGKITDEIRDLMAWEKAASRLNTHLPMPPRNVHREVRERDYFYTPAFAFFPILLAIALALLWETFPLVWLGYAILVLSSFAWLLPFTTHFEVHNRSHDWVARNFARNVLSSVPQNGILITFGDNDTFPLWYIQMVEGFRTDVSVINSSLVQMDWYQEQLLRQRPDIRVASTIESREQSAYRPQVSPKILLKDTVIFFAGDSLWRPGPGDQLIAEIVANNWPRIPVAFMYNANPSELPGGPEMGDRLVPLAGMVRVLGMPQQEADSLVVQRIAREYDFGGFDVPHWRYQESTSRAAVGYRYLFRLAESLASNPADLYAIRNRMSLME